MWQGIQNGLLSGITSLALSYGAEAVGLNPLIGSVASNAIAAAIEGFLNHQNIFTNIGKHLTEGILNVLPTDNPNDPWMHAVYISQVLDFARIIREAPDPLQGIVNALETYATAVFHQQTINSIIQAGGILDMVTGRAGIITDPSTGNDKKRIWTTDEKKYYVDIDPQTGALLERKERIDGVDVTIRQVYETDASGKLILKGRIVEEEFSDGIKKVSGIDENNKTQFIRIEKDGEEVVDLKAYNGNLVVTDDNKLETGIYVDRNSGTQYVYQDGKLVDRVIDTSLDTILNKSISFPTLSLTGLSDNQTALAMMYSLADELNNSFEGNSDDYNRYFSWNNVSDALLKQKLIYDLGGGTELRFRSEETKTALSDALQYADQMSYDDIAEAASLLLSSYTYNPEQFADAQQTTVIPPTSQQTTALVIAAPGIGPHPTDWIYQEKYKLDQFGINGEKVMAKGVSWTEASNWGGSAIDYLRYRTDAVYQNDVKQRVITQLRFYRDSAAGQGVTNIDIYTDSFGAKYIYDILKADADSGNPEFHIRNLVNINSQMRYFGASDLPNVENWVNIYNKNDIINNITNPLQDAIMRTIITQNPFANYVPQIRFINDACGSIKPYVPRVNEQQIDIPHEVFWNDSRIRDIMLQYGN